MPKLEIEALDLLPWALLSITVYISSASSAADTDDWRDLLPWATPDERRTLLDSEHLAARYFGELARRGLGGLGLVEAFEYPAALEVLAVVLASHHGDPMRLMDGEPLGLRF